jgi:glycerol-3-phosphate dehydrogenase
MVMGRLSSTARETFDVLIVGGGIVGAGIARDAALRGLRVALFEARDFGSGTTAGSTRLVHGGLRYLEMLDFGLVRLDLREREALLKNAPHLVKPLRFLVPIYGRSLFYRLKLSLGMWLYDLLSFDKSLPGRRFLSREEVLRTEPHLETRDLQGAASYYDAQVALPERLCLENVIEAGETGAMCFNYAEVTGALTVQGRVTGLKVRDGLSGEEVEVTGRVIVNAAGPWFDSVAGRLAPSAAPRVRKTKGIHLACPQVTSDALVLFSRDDHRLFFAIPWLGYTWLGTTDTDFTDDPGTAQATPDDAAYLMRSVREFIPTMLPEQIRFSNAGVRALVLDEGSASSVSRQHLIVDEARSGRPGLISVIGGKLTGYRAIAEEATDAVCRSLGVAPKCQTAGRVLPGARRSTTAPGAKAPVNEPTMEHLGSLYGSRASEVIRLAASRQDLAEPLGPNTLDIAAQVVFAVRAEQCLKVSDFLLRRTRLGFGPDQGRLALPRVAALMAAELGWTDVQREAQCALYLAHVAESQAFRGEGHRASTSIPPAASEDFAQTAAARVAS